ncbi:MAG: hypothetical protein ABI268_11335 [Rhodanobacter sp.]
MTIWLVVIISHLGLLALLLFAKGPLWHDGHTPISAGLKIMTLRFIDMASPPRSNASNARKPVSIRKPLATHRHQLPRKSRSSVAANDAPVMTVSTPPTSPPASAIAPKPGYIAGVNLLHGDDLDRSSHIRLPGTDVVVVPGLHMIDPRAQGVAGVARMLQGLLGVPDTHCVTVDAWRQLSTREMLARHMSPEQVQKTAARYGCLPKT